MGENGFRFAVLIDADNVSYKDVGSVLDQVRILGKICIKRVYGDFTTPQLAPWRETINSLSLTPMQQFSYTSGKNVTDSKMIIDAMDILYAENVNAFCIMSSDSDFTGVAKRLKESGIFVCGAGKGFTPSSFVNACDRFWTVEEKEEPKPSEKAKAEAKIKGENPAGKEPKVLGKGHEIANEQEVVEFAKRAIEVSTESMVLLGKLMPTIYSKFPSINCKDYGVGKALDFFAKRDCFKIEGEGATVAIALK
jgi:uncharacterized protein (TIGR00288 family)